MTYTAEELEAAKAFLRDRLRNERSMSADVERLLEMYAGYLLTALFGNASEQDIELLISDLVAELMADVELLAVDEHDRHDEVVAYMLSERHGDTLEGRVRKRVGTFYNEVFAVYLAGQVLGKGRDELLASVKKHLKDPWQSELLQEAREKQERGEVTAGYPFKEPHYGKGNPVSSLVAIDRMLCYAVADAWEWWNFRDQSEKGARGYFVVRGSSYPCEVCDSYTGTFFFITDELSRPQYHLNCCCLVVYSYVDRV